MTRLGVLSWVSPWMLLASCLPMYASLTAVGRAAVVARAQRAAPRCCGYLLGCGTKQCTLGFAPT